MGVILYLFLSSKGLSELEIGSMLTLTLAGDAIISLTITIYADSLGRRKMLFLGALLMIFAGLTFAYSRNFYVLTLAATIGVISPSGAEIGPFMALEQSILSLIVTDNQRTSVFAWYNLAGTFSQAIGVLLGGYLPYYLKTNYQYYDLEAYQVVVLVYVFVGFLLLALVTNLSSSVEIDQEIALSSTKQNESKWVCGSLFSLSPQSQKIILRLSLLFALDSFGGALVLQSFISYWFHEQYDIDTKSLGGLMFGCNLFAAISALSASWIASKIGLIQTMVFTHLPSNILLMMIPLMPNKNFAMLCLLARFSISQMDVPTRQSFTVAVVAPEERTIAGGVTNIIRSIGAALSPIITGIFMSSSEMYAYPFFVAGGIKVVYDLLIWWQFNEVKPPEERQAIK
eukprot:TRINITY_DN5394_c0_g1_i1.p1 TRINITY_DN5394_c0_g1~~TRINITY_DN5394_c0_g1_i1.p1  ORF type:complete len:435 (-),score=10.78 TRINITY_DN5394_c0_g1_i1:25-1221(-)